MAALKKIIAKILPRSAKDALKYALRSPKRISAYSKRLKGHVVRKEDIIRGLGSLGIKKGDTLMVHSSLSAFGYVEGGATGVIQALLETVGPEGNVCMPCFGPLPDGKTFDAGKTASGLGKISDFFWRLPDAKRSLSPTHSVACVGKDAEFICNSHHLDATPFAKNSPYYKMLGLDAWLLLLGSPLGRVTIYHVLEDIVGKKFPLRVYLPEPNEFDVIDQAGKKTRVTAFVHDLALNPLRIDNNQNVEGRFKGDLQGTGDLQSAAIGSAEVLAIRVRALLDTLQRFLKEGKTIYASGKETKKAQP